MKTMDQSIHELYRRNLVSLDDACAYAHSPEEFKKLCARTR